MIDYFIILIFFPIIFLLSYITSKFLLRYNYGPFTKMITILAFVGVAVHEISHFIACVIVGVRPRKIGIKFRSEITHEAAPHGYVDHSTHNITFLQNAFIALAPLFISTWLFFWSLDIALNPIFNPFFRIIMGFICLSLILGAAPSSQDFRTIWVIFKRDTKYSIYQIILIFSSAFLVWMILFLLKIVLFIDLIYYVLVGISYYPVKYFFIALRRMFYLVMKRKNKNLNYHQFIRKKFRPTKPNKLGIEEAHW
ncbi:MAG: hypothetical protein EU539_01805 [Promethearchaeota archaeon]|nr:MAG: hypothetical protein EU539_01805 [Candidatus Lokiarchaeota archaeon]